MYSSFHHCHDILNCPYLKVMLQSGCPGVLSCCMNCFTTATASAWLCDTREAAHLAMFALHKEKSVKLSGQNGPSDYKKIAISNLPCLCMEAPLPPSTGVTSRARRSEWDRPATPAETCSRWSESCQKGIIHTRVRKKSSMAASAAPCSSGDSARRRTSGRTDFWMVAMVAGCEDTTEVSRARESWRGLD